MAKKHETQSFIRNVEKDAKSKKLSIKQVKELKGGGKSKPGPWT